MPDLERIVHPPVHPLGVLRKRLALGTGFLIGAASVVALVMSVARHPVAPAALPIPPPPAPAVAVAPPIVVMIDRTIEAPPPPPPGAALECPVIARPDLPIGSPIDPQTLTREGGETGTVVAAAAAPELAVLQSGGVWVSDDDGRTFRAAFEEHDVVQIAIDRDGTVFAISGDQLGVRAPGGRTSWRAFGGKVCGDTDRCVRAIGVNGTQLVAFVDDQIRTSEDQGRTWKPVLEPDFAWYEHDGRMFSWRGALYQVSHYRDMCGVDDLSTFRLDGRRKVAHDTFHNYWTPDQPVLEASSDVDATWTWREKCWQDDVEHELGRCAKRDATRSALLAAATLLPMEGARALAVYDGSAIELCPAGARQIYRKYPFDRIDAVDSVGRPLVMTDLTLVRWSPVHGWRKLQKFVPPDARDAE